jgi:multimeric flavodoxin WrbA
MKCFENKNGHCVFDDDIVNSCIDKMVEADGIILGSPVYFLDVTAEMKGLIDRAGFVSMANGGLYRRRAGMAVAAVRRSGGSRQSIPCSTSCSPAAWLFRDSRS